MNDFDLTTIEFIFIFYLILGAKNHNFFLLKKHQHAQAMNLLSSFCLTGRNSNATEMGKKGSWFSAIKRVFTHYSKGKVVN